MSPITDHPLRYKLSNELHARPFPALKAPCRAVYLAVKKAEEAASRDRNLDLEHLFDLLDRYGATHPQPGATHYFGKIGQYMLKWEQHTEFVTYTVFLNGLSDRPFDPADFEVFPNDWLERAPGVRMTSALIRCALRPDDATMEQHIEDWFVSESVAMSSVIDDQAVIAGDFRIDTAGHLRFGLFVGPDVGERRMGRIVQRLCEIETYKVMSMLGFTRVKWIAPRISEIDKELTDLMDAMTHGNKRTDQTLKSLLSVSAELETLSAQTSFRFGATGAYEAIVTQRISVLREERFNGRQTFAEFMMRRYDPAMRTVKATEQQLANLSNRAMRAADLLRTMVEVERSAQNQQLLESMNHRADMQLRLQETVEGLSVVAISYYAVSLMSYLLYPVASLIGLSKGMLTALVTLPVVLFVWMMIRRIRKMVETKGPDM